MHEIGLILCIFGVLTHPGAKTSQRATRSDWRHPSKLHEL